MRASYIITLFFVVFIFSSVFAAKNEIKLKIVKKTFKREESGFKEAWKNVKSGDSFFDKGGKGYVAALTYYNLAYAYNPSDPSLNCKLGICYLYSDQKTESLSFLQKAYEFNESILPEMHFYMGRAYHLNLEFDNAIEEYNKHLATLKPKKQKKYKPYFDKYIVECQSGKELVTSPVNADITSMGASINSEYDDYNSIFSSTGLRLYFTSKRDNSHGGKKVEIGKKMDEDIYVSYNKEGEWSPATDIGKPINNDNNNAALYLSGDHDKLYVYNGDKKGGDIYVSGFKNDKWKKPKRLEGKFNTKFRETTLNFSTDEGDLYFVTESKSKGGKDLYHSKIDEKEKWSKPENMGDKINTPFNEESPYISRDGTMLFFSSRGHNSMGGYDIFKCEKLENDEWSEPENLGYPVNTPENELYYSLGEDGYGYYSAFREDGLGGMDIYRVLITDEVPVIEEPEEIIDTLIAIEPVVDSTILLEGMIRDSTTLAPVFAKIEITDPDSNMVVSTIISDRLTGNYMMKLPVKKDYKVELTANGYMFRNEQLDLMSQEGERVFSKDFYLIALEVAKKVVLNNIFFENGKATLSATSNDELDRISRLMTSTPTLKIEISGHTDNTGSYEVNARLSKARAKAVVDYLTGKGIEADRLKYEGYAYSQPIAPNDTPSGRQKNRRVEFKILSK